MIDACLEVHKELGPGLLESAYQGCLAYELRSRGIEVEREVRLPVQYRALSMDVGYRIDMLINSLVIIENKSIREFLPIHEAQLLTYLKLSEKRLGFLINWNVPLIKHGIKRIVNGL